MKVLAHVKPERVFHYFEEICGIPHGSGNTEKISNYLVEFATAHGLNYVQDTMGNVVIYKEGSSEKENHPPVMLQGHMDMVCEKVQDCALDFEKEGLDLELNDGIISARGTTLGGDDGIAVAYMLAILEAADITHPPIEAVFTVDEEIGLLGAEGLDASHLKAKTMINIDSEEEGFLLAGCAGGATAELRIPVTRTLLAQDPDTDTGDDGDEMTAWIPYKITVSGLRGGHSGTEIDKGRANASMILGRLLQTLQGQCRIRLLSLEGGSKDNAIPRDAHALILCRPADKAEEGRSRESCDPGRILDECRKDLSHEYRLTDPDIAVGCESMSLSEVKEWIRNHKEAGYDISAGPDVKGSSIACITEEDTEKVIAILRNYPNGIQRMSSDIPGLVQTSLNLGIMKTEENAVSLTSSVRSSIGSEKKELISRLQALADLAGGSLTLSGDYPAWEYREESPLRDLMVEVYSEQYGREPVVQTIHAGLECGLFADKIPGLDCISFGPDIKDIHTPDESMDAESVRRTWDYLLEVLARL
jgi:dipeptidase D